MTDSNNTAFSGSMDTTGQTLSGHENWNGMIERTCETGDIFHTPNGLSVYVFNTYERNVKIRRYENMMELAMGRFDLNRYFINSVYIVFPTPAHRFTLTLPRAATFRSGILRFVADDATYEERSLNGELGAHIFEINNPTRYLIIEYEGELKTQGTLGISQIEWS